MAFALRGVFRSTLRQSAASLSGAARAFTSGGGGVQMASTRGAGAWNMSKTIGVGMVCVGKWFVDNSPKPAKCESRRENASSSRVDVATEAAAESSIRARAGELYSEGRLAEVYKLLNEDASTKENAALLFQLAQATHKLSLAAPQPERRRALNNEALLVIRRAAEEEGVKRSANRSDRADIQALYGTIIQHRGHRKRGEERKRLMAVARQRMTDAFREDADNFNANYALADLHYEMAKERTELGGQSHVGIISIWGETNNNELGETDKEISERQSLWRATARHAYIALKANPNDIHCINYMAQAKFAIGDLQSAKLYTVRAKAAEPRVKFDDEKKAVKEAKELMDKINEILSDKK